MVETAQNSTLSSRGRNHTKTARNQLSKLLSHFQETRKVTRSGACRIVASRLDDKWDFKYLYQIDHGDKNPGPKLQAKINRLYETTLMNRPRMFIKVGKATSVEQLEAWKKVPMAARIKMMNKLAKFKE